MKKLVVLLMAAIFATSAMAVIDPDPNMIGIYFDTNADVVSAAPGGNAVAYVIATNCTYESIYAFECSIFVDNVGLAGFVNAATVPTGMEGFNIGTAPEVIISYGAPIPVVGPATVIAEIPFGYYSNGYATFTIGASNDPAVPGFPNVQVGPTFNDVVPMGDSANGGVCAVLGTGGPDVVGNESASFGGVKALYR
jgi:hypothetical protein